MGYPGFLMVLNGISRINNGSAWNIQDFYSSLWDIQDYVLIGMLGIPRIMGHAWENYLIKLNSIKYINLWKKGEKQI